MNNSLLRAEFLHLSPKVSVLRITCDKYPGSAIIIRNWGPFVTVSYVTRCTIMTLAVKNLWTQAHVFATQAAEKIFASSKPKKAAKKVREVSVGSNLDPLRNL